MNLKIWTLKKGIDKLCPEVDSRTPLQTMSDDFSTPSCEATYALLNSDQTQS